MRIGGLKSNDFGAHRRTCVALEEATKESNTVQRYFPSKTSRDSGINTPQAAFATEHGIADRESPWCDVKIVRKLSLLAPIATERLAGLSAAESPARFLLT